MLLLVGAHRPGLAQLIERIFFCLGHVLGFYFKHRIFVPYPIIDHVPVLLAEGNVEFFHGYFRCLRSILRALR